MQLRASMVQAWARHGEKEKQKQKVIVRLLTTAGCRADTLPGSAELPAAGGRSGKQGALHWGWMHMYLKGIEERMAGRAVAQSRAHAVDRAEALALARGDRAVERQMRGGVLQGQLGVIPCDDLGLSMPACTRIEGRAK